MSFNKLLLKEKLKEDSLINEVIWYDSINSSQDEIKTRIKTRNCNYVVGAEEMTTARGQYERKFITAKGKGLYFSLAIPKKNSPNIIQHTKLIMAVSIAKAIKSLTNLNIKIKFPNDIYLGNKKLCGVLVEEYKANEQNSFLIIGTGLNVNESDFPQSIREKTTSIKLELGYELSREVLCAEIINQLSALIYNYQSQGIEFLKKEYSNHIAYNFIGKLKTGKLIECEFVDLTENGYLIVYSKAKKQYYTFYYSDLIKIKI